MASDRQDLQRWYEEYMAEDVKELSKDSAVIKVVSTDDLDMDGIEQRICTLASSIIVTNGFCGPCQDLLDNWPEEDGLKPNSQPEQPKTVSRTKSFNTKEMEASTRHGCRFCSFLLQVMKDGGALDIFRKIEARLEHLGQEERSSFWARNVRARTELLWLDFPGKVTAISDFERADVMFMCRTLLPSENCCDQPVETLDLVNNWLRTCSEDHYSCGKIKTSKLPTRLISIAGDKPRLVITASLGNTALPLPYATLSYCWGKREFIQLRSGNLDAYIKEIPVEDLPKTFTDAFKIASALGVCFIWIDALCIIQDDMNDWRNEAALMSSVYGGSHINIAASSAKDVYGGCFLKQPYFRDGFDANVTVRGVPGAKEFHSFSNYQLAVTETHLASRGWALQEKILPSRTIHFGDRGVFWECRSIIASEGHPAGIFNASKPPLLQDYHIGTSSFWERVVRLYSAANLSHRSDKFPALSGIARAVFDKTGGEYLAGLWREKIELYLCWKVAKSRLTQKRQDLHDPDWTAPTWSWASIEGVVHFPDIISGDGKYLANQHSYSHVLDVEMKFVGDDVFGQVSHGALRIGCSVIAAGQFYRSATPDRPMHEQATLVTIKSQDGELRFSVWIDCIDDDYIDCNEMIYLLPFLGGGNGFKLGVGRNLICERELVGLVLRKSIGAAGEFCRIGVFKFYQDREEGPKKLGEDDCYEPFLQLLDEVGATTAKAVCAEVIENPTYPKEKYVITII